MMSSTHTHTNEEDSCILECTYKVTGYTDVNCQWIDHISLCPIHTNNTNPPFVNEMRRYMTVMKDNKYLSKDVLNE